VENFDGRRVPVKLDGRRNKKGSYPYYGASGIIDYVDDYLFDGEYLLIGEDGANLVLRSSPIAFKASGKFWVNNHAHIVQPKDRIPLDYLLHFFAVTDLKPYVTGAAQPKLTQGDLNSIPVPMPPPSDQQRIASQLSAQMASAERLRQTLAEQLDAINQLPAALLRRAFSGEL
jgi:type I restriction enzyme S subunit